MHVKTRTVNPEVLYTESGVTPVDRSDVDLFKKLASENPRKRVRLCAHDAPSNTLHEMVIVHERGAYVRPHKHPGKSESSHVIEGVVDVVVFDDDGNVTDIIAMGDYASGRTFYYRMAVPLFHTLLIRSDVLVFHETTNGPFDRRETVFASWAPEDGDEPAIDAFLNDVERKVRAFTAKNEEIRT